MQTTQKLIFLGVLAQAWAVAGCSSSSGSPAANVPDSSAAGETDAGATDAVATVPIMELNDAASASPPPSMVMCGSMTCNAPTGGMVPTGACCLPNNGCGAMIDLSALGMGAAGAAGPMDGGCLDTSPGNPDPSCPSQTIMGFSLPGCCSKAGTCASDLTMAGLGCNSLSALGALAGGGGGMAAAPQACTPGKPGTAPAEGGAPAAEAGSPMDAGAE